MKKALLIWLAIIAIIFGCTVLMVATAPEEERQMTQVYNTSSPIPTVTPSRLERCQEAPESIVDKLNDGLTAFGDTKLVNVSIVDNNNDRPWRFIGGQFVGPGFDGKTAVWATASLDLNRDALIVAADFMAEEFSVWGRPMGDARFASHFDDEIDAAHKCAK